MSFKIVVDSCCDLLPEYRKDEHFCVVPLTLSVGGYEIIDDDTFNQADFLKRVKECSECPKSACPSPQSYMEEYGQADDIYVITLSDQLSGSYNSAENARKMYIEENGEKNIHVFNSISAAAGEVLLAKMVFDRAVKGMSFEQVVREVEEFKADMQTYFVLESLDTLKKNGRLTGLKAVLASTLNIRPVMRGTRVGTIEKVGQCRGFSKSVQKMVEMLNEVSKDSRSVRPVVICHCNNLTVAQNLKKQFLRDGYPEVLISDAAGVSSMYANDGGIIVSL